MSLEARVASYVGAFLSTYDETATEGVERLQRACDDDAERPVVHALLDDPAAVDAFIGVFARPKCSMAAPMAAAAALLRVARKPQRALLMRLLLGTGPRGRVREALERFSDQWLPATVAAHELLAAMLGHNAKLTAAKFGRQVPIKAASFTDAVPFSMRGVRVPRVKLLIAFLRARHPQVVAAAVTQHGVLARLAEDLVELVKREGDEAVVEAAVAAIRESFVENDGLQAAEKRLVLQQQRQLLKAIVALLAAPKLAEGVASMLRRLVNQIIEPSRDYALLRDAEDSRMPNFVVFQLLRYLRPKQRALDAHLVVYVLHRCPDLFRPYMLRVGRTLPDYDGSVPVQRAAVGVCNLLSRVFLSPIPDYITSPGARLLLDADRQHTFFDLTPEAVADEIVPPWLREAAHRQLLSSESPLLMTFVVQVAQAVVDRAARVKAALREVVSKRIESAGGVAADGTTVVSDDDVLRALQAGSGSGERLRTAVDLDGFMGRLDSLLLERMPRREVITPIAMRLAAAVAQPQGAPADARDTKEQFVVQRLYLLLHSMSALFNERVSFGPMLTPAIALDAVPSAFAIANVNGTTVRSLAMLVLHNLSRQIKLPQLTSVRQAADGDAAKDAKGKSKGKGKRNAAGDDAAEKPKAAEKDKAPLLVELLLWAVNKRNAAVEGGALDVAAMRAVAAVLAATARHVLRAAPAVHREEAALWLRHLTPAAAIALSAAIIEAGHLGPARQAAFGADGDSVLAAVCQDFMQRRANAKAGAAPNSLVAAADAHLDELAAVVGKVAKRWTKRDATADDVLGTAAEAQAASAGDVDVAPQMLRRVAADVAHRAEQHVLVVDFFTRHALPAAVTLGGSRADLAALEAAGATSTPFRRVADAVLDDNVLANVDAQPLWLAAHALNVHLPQAARSGDAATVALATETCLHVLGKLPRLIAALGAAEEQQTADALAITGLLLLTFVAVRHTVMHRALDPAGQCVSRLREALLGAYGGTLSVHDRIAFATVALLEPQATGDASSSASDAGDGAAVTPADASGDDDDEDSHSDDDDEHPVVRGSSILGLPQKANRSERAGAAGDTSKPKKQKRNRRSPAALRALRNARFLVGGQSCIAMATPEVETLVNLVDSVSDRELVFNAMRIPLRAFTPVPDEASMPALRLIFPDVDDRRGAPGKRWYQAAPDANGVLEPHDVDTVSGAVWEPRFLLPLVHTVVALRYKHTVPVPTTPVVRMVPWLVRCLSSLDGALRTTAASCLGLLYRSLHPLPRLIVNTVRLHLQRGLDPERQQRSAFVTRLAAHTSAHLTLAFGPLGHKGHPLHELVTASLNLPDERAVPLEDVLVDFPSSAVVGLPSLEHPDKLVTTSHLRHVLEQLRFSCVCWQDAAFLQRRNVLPLLCVTATTVRREPAVFAQAVAAIRGIALCHADDVARSAAVHDHVVPWAANTLLTAAAETDVAGFEAVAGSLTSLLRHLTPFFGTSSAHASRLVAAVASTVQFARSHNILTRQIAHDCRCVAAPLLASGHAHASAEDVVAIESLPRPMFASAARRRQA